MGTTKNVSTMPLDHSSRQLATNWCRRVEELGIWVRNEFHVSGNSWEVGAAEIDAASLGRFAVGVVNACCDATTSQFITDNVNIATPL
ncbi:hypothetical protein GIB67_042053 [Kingdonia uniflora]|uniref:Uncharacterized protein n=1 Tax=Kingdonia uniflora TaxID=39325 RepID=A0A7J7MW03_9MAGN|nr:hypothetical protein GIB67_042053 [Kingdonia uniflora]